MKEYGGWSQIKEFSARVEDQVQLYWREFDTDNGETGNREALEFARDPVKGLQDAGFKIDQSWHIFSTVANHQFGLFWRRTRCTLMLIPDQSTAVITCWKQDGSRESRGPTAR